MQMQSHPGVRTPSVAWHLRTMFSKRETSPAETPSRSLVGLMVTLSLICAAGHRFDRSAFLANDVSILLPQKQLDMFPECSSIRLPEGQG
jgi:hypothetical protein